MPRRHRTLTAALAVTAASLAGVALPLPGTSPAGAASDRLRLAFGSGESLAEGTHAVDTSGFGHHGVVRTRYGGRIVPDGGAADFPGKCAEEPCPNAMIEVADAAALDPGRAAFEWGASILLRRHQTAPGENVLQKGRWGDAGGQWKLQVDKTAGRPSCVVSGMSDVGERRVVVTSSVGIADGVRHSVVCRRTAAGVEVAVDGVVRGSASMPVVNLSNSAPITIGAKEVAARDNDQFHGVLDDVFMRIL